MFFLFESSNLINHIMKFQFEENERQLNRKIASVHALVQKFTLQLFRWCQNHQNKMPHSLKMRFISNYLLLILKGRD